ncbi:hypothetical protein LZZ85_27920 [Terrimonas sp. NA20]|uniref:DUF7668 domain-containing protein n=1 Tax=Terrimonas ginsenosidimutans TaxID=2908004 RepID=A0ABS9L0L8_9BACT|nr:hypothetical protein [Terrimonas ginsenosidimutans]MCG2618160.1 hypothetical protein [Terrimonas ginsenosidimutans]
MSEIGIGKQVKNILLKLKDKKYRQLAADDYLKRVSAEEMNTVISDYGGEVTVPPDHVFNNLDITPIIGTEEYTIHFNLWIDDKESDLTLILTCSGQQQTDFRYTIDDILIM